ESRQQRWADPETGLSPHFWSRSIGWYMMAIVDVLDFLPEDHKDRPAIINILRELSASIEKFRDAETGMWYQVTDLGNRKSNYFGSTSTIMSIDDWNECASNGYLDEGYLKKGEAAYDQF